MGLYLALMAVPLTPAAQLVDALRSAASVAEVARAGRLPKRSVQNVLDGVVPSVNRAAEICDALGLELYIGPPRDGRRSESQPPETQIPPLAAFSPRVEMPVRAWTRCSLEGVLSGVKDYRDAPAPEKLTDPEAFYALASGVSMRPEGIETGDYCLVSPRTELEAGQRVWLKDRQGQEAIKRLVKIDKASYHLRGWLPAEGGPQKPYDDQWRRSNVAESGVVLAVYRGSPSAKDPPPLIPDPRAAPAPTPVAEPPPAMLPPDLERHTQGLVRAVAAAGGDPIPPDLRAKLLGPRRRSRGSGGEATNIRLVASGAEADEPAAAKDASSPEGSSPDSEGRRERITGPYARDVRPAAGPGEMIFEESSDAEVSLPADALTPWARPEAVVFVAATGDSMLPTVRDRDLLAVDSSRIEPLDGQIFVVQTDAGLVVKRLRRIRRRWHLVSDNSTYEPRAVTESDRIVGQVAGVAPPSAAAPTERQG